MQLGIFAKTFAGSNPETVMSRIKGAGYKLAHYNMSCSGIDPMPLKIDIETVDAVIKARLKNNISLCGLSATYNMIHPDPFFRANGMKSLKCLIEIAVQIGAKIVTVCTGTRNPENQWCGHPDNNSSGAWTDLLEEIEKAVVLAEQNDIYLGIEPELANVVDTPAKARKLFSEIQSDRLKIILDPANLFEKETIDCQRSLICEAIETLGDYIVMAHAKDRLPDGSFTIPGQGVIDFSYFLNCLRDSGFKGPLVTHGLKASDAKLVGKYLSRLLTGLPV